MKPLFLAWLAMMVIAIASCVPRDRGYIPETEPAVDLEAPTTKPPVPNVYQID